MSTNYIRYNILRVFKHKLDETIRFYTSLCGMTYKMETVNKEHYPFTWSDNNLHIFHYERKSEAYQQTAVCFIVDEHFRASDYSNCGYWKIGIALRDVNAAVKAFNQKGYSVNYGSQFMDVGFMSAMTDPNGYDIELLQHDFESNFVKPSGELGILNQPLNGSPSIGQITIRCADVEKSCNFYDNVLKMKLLCTEQPGNKAPFTLYFYAYTDDVSPSDELAAIENREWLYKKEYTQIEIQHRHNLPETFSYFTNDGNPHNIKLGHVGFCLCVTLDVMSNIKSKIDGCDVQSDDQGREYCFIKDPDGYIIHVTC